MEGRAVEPIELAVYTSLATWESVECGSRREVPRRVDRGRASGTLGPEELRAAAVRTRGRAAAVPPAVARHLRLAHLLCLGGSRHRVRPRVAGGAHGTARYTMGTGGLQSP